MKPHLIKTEQELQRIRALLNDFYFSQPDSYGLMHRDENDYLEYAEVIESVTPGNGSVLDFGCGTYKTPQLIHQRGFSVTGCDVFNEDKLEEYREALGPDGPKLVLYNGNALPFPDSSFDTVASLCVIEHLSHAQDMLQELARVLKPGGHMVIIGPNMGGPHRSILAMHSLLFKKQSRFWQYQNLLDSIGGLIKCWWLTARLLISGKPQFVYIYPMLQNSSILFEQPDDDAIQLNLPVSFKNWFRRAGFKMIEYNRSAGKAGLARLFNRIFPSFATKIHIVARKKLNQAN